MLSSLKKDKYFYLFRFRYQRSFKTFRSKKRKTSKKAQIELIFESQYGQTIIIQFGFVKSTKMIEHQAFKQTVPRDTYSLTYEQLKQEIDNSLKDRFPKAIYYDSNNMLKIKNLQQLDQQYHSFTNPHAKKQGRGGNNVAQNLKKSLKSVIRSKLSSELYLYFQTNYLRKYNIKSQKENYVLIFLFLHQLVHLKKLRPSLIDEIRECVMQNIHKYISHSVTRVEERQNFHSKNIKQFGKYLAFDIDFMRKRDFEEVQTFIKGLFLRKQSDATKAINKVRNIIQINPFLNHIFFPTQSNSIQKIEQGRKR